jgi:hypothetical protein
MSEEVEKKLEGVDLEKRETLRRMIASTAYVVPVVASFAVSGMTVEKALAQSSHSHFVDPFFRLFS